MDGILNVLKPPGLTSHDVVNRIRRLNGVKKCGHSGTLDPGAAGVLPICIGQATRVSEYFLMMPKTYRAELALGIATDTEDASGQIIDEKIVPEITQEMICLAFDELIGDSYQMPPMYSAVSKGGVKLYKLARLGQTIERESRLIQIYKIELLELRDKTILFDVICSRGTYIRTLCTDIARRFDTCGHMSFLLRKAVGPFTVENSLTLEELNQLDQREDLEKALYPLDSALGNLPAISVTEEDAAKILNGNAVRIPDNNSEQNIIVYDPTGKLLALALVIDGWLKPRKVFSQTELT